MCACLSLSKYEPVGELISFVLCENGTNETVNQSRERKRKTSMDIFRDPGGLSEITA